MNRARGFAIFAILAAGAATPSVLAQDIPRQPPPSQPPTPETPRRGNGGGIGIGGLSFSITLAKKKQADQSAREPAIEMRDAEIALFVPDQVVFLMKTQASNAPNIARAAGVTIIETTNLDQAGLTMFVAQLAQNDSPLAAQARLQRLAGVEWAQPNFQFQLLGRSLPKRFSLHKIPNTQLRASGKIVMIDAPVDTGHDNLRGASLTQSFFGVTPSPAPHGTVVAALLVGTGVHPGTAQGASLVSLAAFGTPANGVSLSRTSYLATAMNAASRLRPDVLNLSFGGPTDRLLSTLLDTIHTNGVCVAAAAGNGGPSGQVLFPASHPASLAVTAIDENLRGYAFASQGSRVDVAGFGVGLNAAVPGGRRSVSGTSFATAVVSGALLRMPACSGARSPATMKAEVSMLAQDLGAIGRDPIYGAGLFRLKSN